MNAQTILELLALESRLDELTTLINHDEVAGGADLIEARMQELQEAINAITSQTEPRTLQEIVDSVLENNVTESRN